MPNPLRGTMADLITETRTRIADPNPPPTGGTMQFTDVQVQNALDDHREDVRYLQLAMAPSIVNTPSTGNVPLTIYADYYSEGFDWWESDLVLQGYQAGQPWIVLTPVTADYLVGHWTFEANIFTAGTYPGQFPPVFVAFGKSYDIWGAAADLLEIWSAALSSLYNVTVAGQTLQRAQLMTAKLTLAAEYKRKARPRMGRMTRRDLTYQPGSGGTESLAALEWTKGG